MNGRYLIVGSDTGNLFVLEAYKIKDGKEKTWVQEN